jgi:hypothetical protein
MAVPPAGASFQMGFIRLDQGGNVLTAFPLAKCVSGYGVVLWPGRLSGLPVAPARIWPIKF